MSKSLLGRARDLWPGSADLNPRTQREEHLLRVVCHLIEDERSKTAAMIRDLQPKPRSWDEVLDIHHDGEGMSQLGYVAQVASDIFTNGRQFRPCDATEAVKAGKMLWEALAREYPEGTVTWRDGVNDEG